MEAAGGGRERDCWVRAQLRFAAPPRQPGGPGVGPRTSDLRSTLLLHRAGAPSLHGWFLPPFTHRNFPPAPPSSLCTRTVSRALGDPPGVIRPRGSPARGRDGSQGFGCHSGLQKACTSHPPCCKLVAAPCQRPVCSPSLQAKSSSGEATSGTWRLSA